ncbi:MAG: isoleucine--tRNA ligase [Alphaproteobacteria bacterium]|nr:isoleucine--tRNA ligase [Alphaproteobacteria bacterium]
MDVKDSVFLPKTNFAMRANLVEREPDLLAYWEKIGLFDKIRKDSKNRPKFVLHDGPPFANGHIHLGTALNKVLKDVINRLQQMQGKDAYYIPGWDCHGLPIEWKIEEKYRKDGKDKDSISPLEFREECRQFAKGWIDVQRAEFKRIGVVGDWDNPYVTMSIDAEAEIYKELTHFVLSDQFYRGFRPVMWSVVEKTTLAEAEVEYYDKQSSSIYVAFPIVKPGHESLKDTQAIIWTTTPWTIPGNRAIAYGPEIDYVVITCDKGRFLIAADLLGDVQQNCAFADVKIVAQLKGEQLEGTIATHPFNGLGYDFEVPLLPGDHVITSQGTGLVHTAPGHGEDDFYLGKKFNLEVPQTVDVDGTYYKHVPQFAGQHVFKADKAVMELLEKQSKLLASTQITHSYPHSWRSKAPLIYRTVPQWFIPVQHGGLKDVVLKAIDDTRWIPDTGRNRIRSMVENRPDWCISRQRVWGVPIAIFVHKETGAILKDPKVFARIYDAFKEKGSDVWFEGNYARFLEPDYNLDDYEPIKDIIDVWFESGTTHRFVLDKRKEVSWPADLYLEGSDQHRGWFQSSLLVACGNGGKAPFKTVLTHGFIVDDKGRKISKSLGNGIALSQVIDQYGADILRLWLVSTNYTEDIRVSMDIIKQHSEVYRKIRNTLRFVLGNLDGFKQEERLDYKDLPELEQWILHRLYELDQKLIEMNQSFNLNSFYSELHTFCTTDLSAFYFDIRKDSLYCDAVTSLKRRACRTVLDILFNYLSKWLAPVLCFTIEDAFFARYPDAQEKQDSIHLHQIERVPSSWSNPAIDEKWQKIRDIRSVITGAIEIERAQKKLGSSLQAHPHIELSKEYLDLVNGLDLAEISISSNVTTQENLTGPLFELLETPGIKVQIHLAEGEKCVRCWRILEEVAPKVEPKTCDRCEEALHDAQQNLKQTA